MIKKLGLIVLIVISVMFPCQIIYATEKTEHTVKKQLESLDFSMIEKETKNIADALDNELLDGISLKNLVSDIVSGDIDLTFKELASRVSKIIFKEVYAQLYLLQRLMIIAILGAVIKNLNGSFASKSVGELGFYVCYIVLIFIVITSFKTGAELVSSTVGSMSDAMQAMLPILTGFTLASGNSTQSMVIGPIIVAASQFISSFIRGIIVPGILLVTMLEFVNYITDRDVLKQLSSLLKSIINWGIKGGAVLFMSFLSLQKAGTGGLGRFIGKTAKVAVNAVPVIGDIMTSAIDTAAGLTGLIKNSLGVGAVILIILICMVPIIKIVIMILIYKVTAALIEPISDSKLVKCISGAGNFSVLLFEALVIVEVMFVFSVIILISSV